MPESNTASQSDQGFKPKVLLADDSKMVRVTAQKYLGGQFELILAKDGEEAWKILCADDDIQVVFTDLGMPNLDGFGFIERIRASEEERIRDQPIIVITGASEEEEVRRKVFEVGATDFISKPFKSTELVARAEAHASYRKSKDTLQQNVDMDLLTGLLNIQGLNEQLEKDVSFVNRHNENLAVVVFELDDFDAIFKRLGKQNSEALIKQTASTLAKAIRKEDSAGRCGMSKFTLILPMAKSEGVILLAKRLCQKMAALKISIGQDSLSVFMSAGVATVRKGSEASAKTITDLAEKALRNARAVGKGEVQWLKLEQAKTQQRTAKAISVDELLEAINNGEDSLSPQDLDSLVHTLRPLVQLLSPDQKDALVRDA